MNQRKYSLSVPEAEDAEERSASLFPVFLVCIVRIHWNLYTNLKQQWSVWLNNQKSVQQPGRGGVTLQCMALYVALAQVIFVEDEENITAENKKQKHSNSPTHIVATKGRQFEAVVFFYQQQ